MVEGREERGATYRNEEMCTLSDPCKIQAENQNNNSNNLESYEPVHLKLYFEGGKDARARKKKTTA